VESTAETFPEGITQECLLSLWMSSFKGQSHHVTSHLLLLFFGVVLQISRVSGGERRRVSIGVDLIHNPAVLFLDEPTSGLDSTVALQLMQMLSKMAEDRACTVVLTIHQPSFRILETIKNVLVLAEGCAVYHGPTTAMSEYFMALGKSFIPGGPAAVNQVWNILRPVGFPVAINN
jgi:ABC-type multidrug transport system ATPase subunit